MEPFPRYPPGEPAAQDSNSRPVRRTYAGKDLALLIPTKDRPKHIRLLLESLSAQTVACGRVVIVDGGESIQAVLTGFLDRLPLEYYLCHPPGQIRQRNLGIGKLDDSTPLVGFLDDDLELEPEAIEKMIGFWNGSEPDTAGVGFNVVNAPRVRASRITRLLFRGSTTPGRVLKSGYNSRIDNLREDLRTQWLGGGYTVWRKDVLEKFPQPEIKTRWAIGEDLRFSYPIGKSRPLYVCASARVRHVPVMDQAPESSVHRFRGRKSSLATFYFVASHPELSRAACLWMLSAKCVGQLALGCAKLDTSMLQNGLGQAGAIWTCVRSLFGLADIKSALED